MRTQAHPLAHTHTQSSTKTMHPHNNITCQRTRHLAHHRPLLRLSNWTKDSKEMQVLRKMKTKTGLTNNRKMIMEISRREKTQKVRLKVEMRSLPPNKRG